jgi:DNA-binding transcriptional ArsR family regulator
MIRRQFISRFSPNRTDPEILDQIFVQRRALLDQSVAALRESALSENKHHLLFIGPRGCGKTHLLALIGHQLQKQSDLADRLRIGWLNEDETATTFLDLLFRIYRALSERYPEEFPESELKPLYGYEPDEARDALGQLLVRCIGKRTVLVMLENLDALFAQLDEPDQRAWRAFIQNYPQFATAATAQSLFCGVSDRDQPFFGFFDAYHLKPLTVDEAADLLQRIARLNGDTKLARFVSSPRGRARVRATHHLSGGNHRLYIVLSDFITPESLEELVRPFEEMVDEQLTPYYQERLRWLSPQQRKIVEFLCFCARPVPVKEIARHLFAEHGSIASQLQKLREMGYVRANPRGREALYELEEPLMRLTMQAKSTRDRQPLELIVDFLRIWYDRDEIEQHLVKPDLGASTRDYFSAALARLESGEPNLRHQLLREEFEKADIERYTEPQLERWSDALGHLRTILPDRLGPASVPPGISGFVIIAIRRYLGSPEIWHARLTEGLSVYAKNKQLPLLGDALVRDLADLAKSPLNSAGLDQWYSGWETATSQYPEMKLPLRLLAAGIAYLKTEPRDDTVLLELPREERALVRQALRLPLEQSE